MYCDEQTIDADSKRFWRWCITHRITGFLGFFHVWYSKEHDVSETDPVSETSCSLEYQTIKTVQKTQ
jgi:hypothetical protein